MALRKDKFSGVNSGILIPMDDTQNSASLAGLQAFSKGVSNISSLVNQQEDKEEKLEKENSSIKYYNSSNNVQKKTFELMANADKTGNYEGLNESMKKAYEDEMSWVQDVKFEDNRSALQQRSHKDFDSLSFSMDKFSTDGKQKVLLQEFGKSSQDTASLIYTSPETAFSQTQRMTEVIENTNLPKVKKIDLKNKTINSFTYEELKGYIDLRSVKKRNEVHSDLLNGKYNKKLNTGQIRNLLSLSEKKNGSNKAAVNSAYTDLVTSVQNATDVNNASRALVLEGFDVLSPSKKRNVELTLSHPEVYNINVPVEERRKIINSIPLDNKGNDLFVKNATAGLNDSIAKARDDSADIIVNKLAVGRDQNALRQSYAEIASGDPSKIQLAFSTMKSITDGYGSYLEGKGYSKISKSYLPKTVSNQIKESIDLGNPNTIDRMNAYKRLHKSAELSNGEDFADNILSSIAGTDVIRSIMYAPNQIQSDIMRSEENYKGKELPKNKDVLEWSVSPEAIAYFNSDSASQTDGQRDSKESMIKAITHHIDYNKNNGITSISPESSFREITQTKSGDDMNLTGSFLGFRTTTVQDKLNLLSKSGVLSEKGKERFDLLKEKEKIAPVDINEVVESFDKTPLGKSMTGVQMIAFASDLSGHIVENKGYNKEYIDSSNLKNDGYPLFRDETGLEYNVDMDDVEFRPVNGSKSTFVAMVPVGDRMVRAIWVKETPNPNFDDKQPESSTNKKIIRTEGPYEVRRR